MPKWFSFILTDEKGTRSYCSCLIFTEELSDNLINSVKKFLLKILLKFFY
jgi:hypothetical protein